MSFDIKAVKGKKISFKEGIIFTKIAKKVKIRYFKKEITAILNQVKTSKNELSDEEKQLLNDIKQIKNKNDRENKLNQFNKKLMDKAYLDVGIDISLYLIEMIGDAEDEFVELIASYSKQDENVVIDADLDDIIEVMKIMWENGLYKVFSTFLNKSDDPNNSDEDVLKKTK